MNRKRILLPVDFDTRSDSALEFARHISTPLNAMISCLYVIEDQKFQSNKHANREAKLKQRRDVENQLSEKVNSILNGSKTPFELIVTSGKVSEKVLEKAVDLNAQLIVLSKSNSTESGKKRIGTCTKHIILNAQVPVILTGPCKMENRTNIIVPLDVFKPIDSQVICAIDTANLLCATVSVITVIEKGKLGLRPVYLKRLNEVRGIFLDNHIQCNSHVLTANYSIPETILSFSRKVDSGLILMKTGNKIKPKASYISEITKEIFVKSELPVQCINPKYKSRHLSGTSEHGYNLNALSWSSVKDHLISNQQELEA